MAAIPGIDDLRPAREALQDEVLRRGDGQLRLGAELPPGLSDARNPVRDAAKPAKRVLFTVVIVAALLSGVMLWLGAG